MTNHNTDNKVITLENRGIKVVLDYTKGVKICEFSNKYSGVKSNENRELFFIDFMGAKYSSEDFEITDVSTAQDKKEELVTITMEKMDLDIKARVHLISDKEDSIRVLYQIYDGYKYGVPYEMRFTSPLLAELEIEGASDVYYYPENSVATPDGKQIMKLMREDFANSDVKPPLVVENKNHKLGFSVLFPTLSDLSDEGASQNRNMQLSRIGNKAQLRDHNILINPDASFNDTVELHITALKNGWAEAFGKFRDIWASGYEFSEYEKEDLKWFNDCFVHNFTFLYGKEGYDHEKQEIDVDGLLKQGEDFGGYDTVTYWNQYPRLGIDGRSQWDFHDDFPGGREAMKKAVDKLHDKGVYVFMPYIPWDQGNDESTNSMGDHFAKLLADTDADGYQLDTMNNLPESFRDKCNKVRPGLIMTTQSHPRKKRPLEIITTSWNEFWYTNPMPEIDVLRFLLPKHISPVISRWLRKEDKDLLIKRSKFGAAPMVIWQDIFGRWMPFSAEQRAEIKLWKGVYMSHKDIYQGDFPIPLYPTDCVNLYCNIFCKNDGDDAIYALYNDSEKSLSADISMYNEGKTAKVLLGDGECEIKDGKLKVTVKPGDVIHVLVK